MQQLEEIRKILETREVYLQEQLIYVIYLKIHKENKENEEMWRLKLRSLWLQSGDKNSSLFHCRDNIGPRKI